MSDNYSEYGHYVVYSPPYDPMSTGYVWNALLNPEPAAPAVSDINPIVWYPGDSLPLVAPQPVAVDYLSITRAIVNG